MVSNVFWKSLIHQNTNDKNNSSNSHQNKSKGAIFPVDKARNLVAKEILFLPQKAGGVGLVDLSHLVLKSSIRMAARWATMAPGSEKAGIDHIIMHQTHLNIPIVPPFKLWGSNLNIRKNDTNNWAYNLRILSILSFDSLLITSIRQTLNHWMKWIATIPSCISVTSNELTWVIPYYDQVNWTKMRTELSQLMTSDFLTQLLTSPIRNNPLLIRKEGKFFKTSSLNNKTYWQCFSRKSTSTFSGKLRILHKSSITKDIFLSFLVLGSESLTMTEAFPLILIGEKIVQKALDFHPYSGELSLTAQPHDLTAKYLNFDVPISFDSSTDKRIEVYAPFKYPFISVRLCENDHYTSEQLKPFIRKKKIKKLLIKKGNELFLEKKIGFLTKRKANWHTVQPRLTPWLLSTNVHSSKWKQVHSLASENFWLKLQYHMHRLWWDDPDKNETCLITGCQAKNFNTMEHILLDCNRAKIVYRYLLFWWLGHSNFILDEWHQSIITCIPKQLPMELLIGKFTLSFWMKNSIIIKKDLLIIWRLCCQIVLQSLWSNRNLLCFQKRSKHDIEMWNEILLAFKTNLSPIMDFHKRKNHNITVEIIDLYIAERTLCSLKIIPASFLGWFDGGHRVLSDNAAAGSVIFKTTKDSLMLVNFNSHYLGNSKTNNIAEYQALYDLVEMAVELKATTLHIRGDSLMIVNHLKNISLCRKGNLLRIYNRLMIKLASINYSIEHVKRSWNQSADFLANYANDNQMSYSNSSLVNRSFIQQQIHRFCHFDLQHPLFPKWITIPPEIDKWH